MINEIKTYFEGLATNLKDIGHNAAAQRKAFFFADEYATDSELMEALKSGSAPVVMIMTSPIGEFGDVSNSDNYRFDQQLGIWILKKKPARRSEASKAAIYDAALLITIKLANRIAYDKLKGTLPFSLTKKTFENSAVPAYADGYAGQQMTVFFNKDYNYEVHTGDWTDLDV